jgi:hypothetical protein
MSAPSAVLRYETAEWYRRALRATGVLARRLQNRDPRLKAHRRSLMRVAAVVIGIGGVLALVAAALQ